MDFQHLLEARGIGIAGALLLLADLGLVREYPVIATRS